jgi:hypothetical protein
LSRPGLLVTRRAEDDDLDVAGLAAGAGGDSVLAPDWKYEHPETTRATSRILLRII